MAGKRATRSARSTRSTRATGAITRRGFLGRAVAGAATLTIVPRYVLGGPVGEAPSENVTRAVIGLGRGGGFTMKNEPGKAPKTLAVCDVDRQRMEGALRKAGDPCKGYTDFRHVMDRKDIDVVYVMTPPHWHALVSIAAAQSGKDIYCEKPMTRFIREGRVVAETVRRYGRVFQVGTFGRFGESHNRNSVTVRKIMTSGLLPHEKAPKIALGGGFKVREWSGKIDQPPEPVPGHLDWNMYLGPAPWKPYWRHRTHMSFRGYWDYDGGGLADMAQHYLDGVQWKLGKDETSPIKVRAHAERPSHPDAVRMWGWVEMEYADGARIILESREWGEPYEGETRGYPSLADLSEDEQAAVKAMPDPEPMIGSGQWEFEKAVKLRRTCGGNADVSHRCACLLHLANVAIRTGRELRYDPVAERFVGDEEANRLVDVPMRAPWHL